MLRKRPYTRQRAGSSVLAQQTHKASGFVRIIWQHLLLMFFHLRERRRSLADLGSRSMTTAPFFALLSWLGRKGSTARPWPDTDRI